MRGDQQHGANETPARQENWTPPAAELWCAYSDDGESLLQVFFTYADASWYAERFCGQVVRYRLVSP